MMVKNLLLGATMLLATAAKANVDMRVDEPLKAKPSSVVWFDLMVKDVDRAENFYKDLFGWDFVSQSAQYTLIVAGKQPVGGLFKEKSSHTPGGTTIYFAVDDLAATLSRAKALGARPLMEATPLPDGRGEMAIVLDLDRNSIGFLELEADGGH